MTTTRPNYARLEQMAQFLDKLPEPKFRFSNIIARWRDRKRGSVCGTVCCAIGWMPAIFPKEIAWSEGGPANFIGEPIVVERDASYRVTGRHNFAVAKSFFGITQTEAVKLFAPRVDCEWNKDQLPANARPKAVAAALRRFIAYKQAREPAPPCQHPPHEPKPLTVQDLLVGP